MLFKFEQLELISNVFEFDWKKFDDASSKTTDGRTSDKYRRQPHDSDRCLLAQPARVRFEHALDLNRVVASTTRLITATNF